jgi:hypothetical protein
MNRLELVLDNQAQPERKEDFYRVVARYSWFVVSRQTAMAIERQLMQASPPRWIVFRDLMGARHRLQAKRIDRISESTAAQRAAAREFDREREREDKDDRSPWDDDD